MRADSSPVKFDFQPRLIGGRLDLRPVTAGDWAALCDLGSDPRVWVDHPDRERWRIERLRPYFEEGLASGGALVAIERTSGAVIGWSRYSDQSVQPGEIEIGWTFLGRAWWSGGHNCEMKHLMLGHAFQFVERVIFKVGETNGRSRRALEKIGARLIEGRQTEPGFGVTYLVYAVDRSPKGSIPAASGSAHRSCRRSGARDG